MMKWIVFAMVALLILTTSCGMHIKKASDEIGGIDEDYELTSTDDIIVFSDSAIEYETRKILEKPDGEITVNDVSSITVFTADTGNGWNSNDNFQQIITLDDLKWFKNLQELTIFRHGIKSLAGIEELTNLRKLMVRDNEICSIEPVRNLKNLVRFDCADNPVRDYAPLSNLTNLEELCASKVDMSMLENLTKLKSLYSPCGTISDISVLIKMPDLEYLNLRNNNISNVDSLGNLKNLTYLDIGENNISNIDSLSNLNELTHLDLRDNQIYDFSAIEDLAQLEYICLSGNLVADGLLEKHYPPWMRPWVSWGEEQLGQFGPSNHPLEGIDERLGELVSIDGAAYKIESRRFYVHDESMKNDIDIVFPQIVDMNDNILQGKINKTLYDNAFDILIAEGQNVAGFDNKVTYEITWAGERFLSVKFNIFFYRHGAAYPNDLLYTANIDLLTGNDLKLKDFFAIDDGFIEKFKTCAILDSEKYHIFPEVFEILLQDYSDEELKKSLGRSDVVQNGSKQTDYASYFTDSVLGISFGTSHALGSYAEIVIGYDDLIDNIVIDNELWNELLPSLLSIK